MNSIRALILAAGMGKRLGNITKTVPKCLVEIAGRSLLDHWLDLLDDVAIYDVSVNTHHMADKVERHIQDATDLGQLDVQLLYEPELLGSAGTISAHRDLADSVSDVLVIYADNISNVNLRALVNAHRSYGDPITMMLYRSLCPRTCGIVTLDQKNRVVEFVEKPTKPESDLANAGVYVMTKDAYREIADMRQFDLAADVLPRFCGRMHGWVWNGYHRDIGTPESLASAVEERIFDRRSILR